MKKMGKKGLKIMKLVHIVLCAIWFGATLSMLALSFVVELGMLEIASQDYQSTLMIINGLVVSTSSRAVLATGLLYGVFTKWGFFKNTWVAIKWVLTIGLMISINALAFDITTGCIQLATLIIIFVLSVYKPNIKKNTAQKATRKTSSEAQV